MITQLSKKADAIILKLEEPSSGYLPPAANTDEELVALAKSSFLVHFSLCIKWIELCVALIVFRITTL